MVENPILHSSLQSTLTSPSNLSAMLLRQSRPSIRQLPERITSGHRNPFSDMVPGPTSPLERNPQSPKGWKNRESDGIGLGIVAALEKKDGGRSQAKLIVGAPILHVSAPIAVGSPRTELGCNWRCSNSGVACYGEKYGGFFCGSPPWGSEEIRIAPMADFLSNCYLCRKKLHGKDIYMYRGEKAFCSMECRYQQIVNDEFQEKCGSEALRSSDVSSTSYTDDRLFFTGIAAA